MYLSCAFVFVYHTCLVYLCSETVVQGTLSCVYIVNGLMYFCICICISELCGVIVRCTCCARHLALVLRIHCKFTIIFCVCICYVFCVFASYWYSVFVRWTRCARHLGLVQAHIRHLPASNTSCHHHHHRYHQTIAQLETEVMAILGVPFSGYSMCDRKYPW